MVSTATHVKVKTKPYQVDSGDGFPTTVDYILVQKPTQKPDTRRGYVSYQGSYDKWVRRNSAGLTTADALSTETAIAHDEFVEKLTKECLEGSGIPQELFDLNCEFHQDLEFNGGDLDTPIHNALRWGYSRFGKQAQASLSAIFFKRQIGDLFQSKLSKPRQKKDDKGNPKFKKDGTPDFIKYETPIGNGSRAYLPTVGRETRRAIAKFYKTEVPPCGEDFWLWLELHLEIPIILTEGAKKCLCLLGNGYIAIALTGCSGGYIVKKNGIEIPPELISDLQCFAVKGRKFIIAMDSDESPETVLKVNKAINKTAKLLTARGCEVAIARWDSRNGKAKGVDDLIVNFGLEAWEKAYNEAKSPKYWNIQDRYSRRLNHYKPTLTVNVPDLSTAIAPETIPDRGVVAVISDTGTGKTKKLKRLLANEPKIVKIGHRVSLERNSSSKESGINLSFLNDLDIVKGRLFNNKEQRFLTEFESGRVSLCFESTLKIKVEFAENCDLILDEADQSLRSLISSGTFRKDGKRPIILRHFERLLKSAKRVILLSADLGDREINYICKLRGEEPAMILLNKYKRPRGKCRFIKSDNDSVAVAEILAKAKAGKRILIVNDSLGRVKAIFRLLDAIVKHDNRFSFSSETSGTEKGQKFATNPDTFLKTYQPQILAITPSGFTGLSMEVEYFDEVYGLFYGKSVITDDCIQSLERPRYTIPRTVWASESGSAFSGAGNDTYPLEIKANLKRLTNTTTNLLQLRNELSPEKTDSLNRYDWQENPHLDLYADYESDRNFSMWHFRDCLEVRLRISGYDIEVINAIEDEDVRKAIAEAAEAVELEDALATKNGRTLTKDEFLELDAKDKEKLDDADRAAINKYGLAQYYAIDGDHITVEDVLFDRKGRTRKELSRLENLAISNLAVKKDCQKIKEFSPDEMPASASVWDFSHNETERALSEELGLYPFLQHAISGGKWDKNHSMVQAIATKIKAHAKQVKLVFGFYPHQNMTDCAVIGILLTRLGLRSESERVRVNGNQIYVYHLDKQHLDHVSKILIRRFERLANDDSQLELHPLLVNLYKSITQDEITHPINQNAP